MGKGNTQLTNQKQINKGRRAFRIDDNVLLSISIIPDDQLKDTLKRFPEKLAELEALNNFSDSTKVLTDQFILVRRRYPEVAKYLKILDDKINTLARRQFTTCSTYPDLSWHEVNISANGIRFNHEKELNVNTYLELRLQLSQVSKYILAYGKVVRCEQSDKDSNDYSIAVEFTHINVEDRESIHIHVRGKEIRLIREKNLMEDMDNVDAS